MKINNLLVAFSLQFVMMSSFGSTDEITRRLRTYAEDTTTFTAALRLNDSLERIVMIDSIYYLEKYYETGQQMFRVAVIPYFASYSGLVYIKWVGEIEVVTYKPRSMWHGKYVEWYKNGVVHFEREYDHGESIGEWKEYNIHGALISSVRMKSP